VSTAKLKDIEKGAGTTQWLARLLDGAVNCFAYSNIRAIFTKK
jgi:hypothetical protein